MSSTTKNFEPETLVALLRHRATHQSRSWAYSFLNDSGDENERLTYEQLDRGARAVAAFLQDRQLAGGRALLVFQPGLEFIRTFFGCLYAGVIAVPIYAALGKRRPDLQLAIMAEVKPRIMLTSEHILPKLLLLQEQLPSALFPPIAAADTIPNQSADSWSDPGLGGDDLAFLQYTSGSTSAPKGVMVSHGNILYNERMVRMAFGHHEGTKVCGWLPLYHDMGLIGNVLQPLYVGVPCVLMSPIAFLLRPYLWLKTISDYRITTSGAPDFGYARCVRKVRPEQKEHLDLSCWDLAYNGSEPVSRKTLDDFCEAFEPCGFRRQAFFPCYGLAEATLLVTGGVKREPPVYLEVRTAALRKNQIETTDTQTADTQTLVGCGQTWLDQKVVIVEPNTLEPLPDQRIGEVWVAGRSVAQGFWKRPDETERSFGGTLEAHPGERFLRTGDLGFLRNGELFVTGRIKDLIIIRGQNHYPKDIETIAGASHPDLKVDCGAAFSVRVDGEERLVVVHEVVRHCKVFNVAEVEADIRERLAERCGLRLHRAVLIQTGTLLRTSSGKVKRAAIRDAFLAGELREFTGMVKETAVE